MPKDREEHFEIKNCGNYYTVVNKLGEYENHTHLDKYGTCKLLIKLICKREVPRSPYLQSSVLRISRNKKYKRNVRVKMEKDENRQRYFNPQKGQIRI